MEVRTYGDELRERLKGVPCVLAFETAAEYLGLSNGTLYHTESIRVYATRPLGLDGVKEHLVASLDDVEHSDVRGLLCTSVQQTICDMLRADYNSQVIQESLANFYFEHGESFEGLHIPEELLPKFEHYKAWAVEFYDD